MLKEFLQYNVSKGTAKTIKEHALFAKLKIATQNFET